MIATRILSRWAPSAAALLLLGAAGCMKVKTSVVLTKDGSGSFSETATVDLSKMGDLMEMVKGMMGAGMEGAGAGPGGAGGGGGGGGMIKEAQSSTDMDALKKRLEGKEGVRLQFISQAEDLEKKSATGEVRLAFTSFGALLTAAPGSTTTRNVDISLEQGAGGAWTFTRKMLLPGGMEVGDELPPEAASQMEMGKAMLEPYLGELSFTWTFEVPGTVVSTNGTKNEAGTAVTWKMGFADTMDPKKLKQTVTFTGEGLTLKPFHVRLNEHGDVVEPGAKAPTTAPDGAPKPQAPGEPAAPKAPEAPKEPSAPKEPAPK